MGLANDSIKHTFKTVETRKTSIINIEAEGVDQCYILELVNGSTTEAIHLVKKDSTYNSKLLPVGSYKIKITKDDNCNGKFDDGRLVDKIMPEEIAFFYTDNKIKDLETKENFEFNFKINFKSLFKKMSIEEQDSLRLDSLIKGLTDLPSTKDIHKKKTNNSSSKITSNYKVKSEKKNDANQLAILQTQRNKRTV